MYQKSNKIKNTVLKDVVLKYFLLIHLLSFFYSSSVSIKHYKISFCVKYSVSDLINDVHYCAWTAKLRLRVT